MKSGNGVYFYLINQNDESGLSKMLIQVSWENNPGKV